MDTEHIHPPNNNTDQHIIQDKEYILILDNQGKYHIVQAKKQGKFKVKKRDIQCNDFIGKIYGKIYNVTKDNQLEETQLIEFVSFDDDIILDDDNDIEAKDNRELVDNNLNQELSRDEILKLKNSGISGEAIVQNIVNNSKSFQSKTEYSQQKYIKKKLKKHDVKIRMEKPSIETVAEALYIEQYAKIKLDSLSLFLHYANLGNATNVLIFENCNGILLSSVLLRTEQCSVTIGYAEQQKPQLSKFKCLDYLNISQEKQQNIQYLSVAQIINQKEQLKSQYSQILISTDIEPDALVQECYELLKPSGDLVIFCPFLEPLGKCYDFMLKEKKFVNIILQDIYSREYQVLKNRTHPHMTSTGFSGYILYGIRVSK